MSGRRTLPVGKLGGQEPQFRRGRLESFEHVQTAAGARKPAVVLIRHVRERTGHAFDQQQVVEIQQRIAQRQLANDSVGLQQQRAALVRRAVVRQRRRIWAAMARSDVTAVLNVDPLRTEIAGQPESAVDHFRHRIDLTCPAVPTGRGDSRSTTGSRWTDRPACRSATFSGLPSR